jgi:hypothetical protein
VVCNRVHLLELGHVRRAEPSGLAPGHRNPAARDGILASLDPLLLLLRSQIRLDPLRFLPYLVHDALCVGTQLQVRIRESGGAKRKLRC